MFQQRLLPLDRVHLLIPNIFLPLFHVLLLVYFLLPDYLLFLDYSHGLRINFSLLHCLFLLSLFLPFDFFLVSELFIKYFSIQEFL